MKLVTSLLNMLRSISTFFSNSLNSKANKLDEYNDANVDIGAILNNFVKKSDAEIKSQLDSLTKEKAELEKHTLLLDSKKSYLSSAIEAIDKMETIIADESTEKSKLIKTKGDLSMVKIGASDAIKTITMLENAIGERTVAIENMEINIQNNRSEAFKIKLELENLKLSKSLIATAKSMTSIKLSDDYDLKKLQDIVNSEKALFKASQEVEEKFNSDPQEVVEKYVNEADNDAKLQNLLDEYRQNKAA